MVNARAFKPYPLGSAPLKTYFSGNFWSSRKQLMLLNKQKCVLRKCYGVSWKWWMLELSTLCIVFSNPDNLLVGISGALGMKGSLFLSKHVFWEYAAEYSRNGKFWSFEPFAIVFSTPEYFLCKDFWSSSNKRNPLSKKKCVLRKCCGVPQK